MINTDKRQEEKGSRKIIIRTTYREAEKVKSKKNEIDDNNDDRIDQEKLKSFD